jgi:hypothetical protein
VNVAIEDGWENCETAGVDFLQAAGQAFADFDNCAGFYGDIDALRGAGRHGWHSGSAGDRPGGLSH